MKRIEHESKTWIDEEFALTIRDIADLLTGHCISGLLPEGRRSFFIRMENVEQKQRAASASAHEQWIRGIVREEILNRHCPTCDCAKAVQ